MVPYDESFVVNRVSPTFFDLYQQAGRIFGDDASSLVWPSRVQYDICAGVPPESSLSKHASECAQALGLGTPPPLPPTEPGTYNGPLRFGGRYMTNDVGKFHWRGATSFRLAHMVFNGEDIIPWLDWCAAGGINVVRVASMCHYMFQLSPHDGIAAMPIVLQLARDRGIYVEMVGILDSAIISSVDVNAQLNQLCDLRDQYGNALIEGANEPYHDTQRLDIPDLVKEFAAGDRAPYACGAHHGAEDENREFLVVPNIDYGTVHADRNRAPWGNCRHTREIQVTADDIDLYLVSDEPEKEMSPSLQFGYGAIARVGAMGDTYHSEHGKMCRLPNSDEQAKFDARRRAWDCVPNSFIEVGRFTNFNWADHPLDSFHMYDDDARAYSRVTDNEGYVALTHADDPIFRNGWVGQQVDGIDEGEGNVASIWKCVR